MKQETQVIVRWTLFLAVLFVLALVSWQVISRSEELYRTTPAFRKMERIPITLVNDEGRRLRLTVRVADEEDERTAGFEGIGPGVVRRSLILVAYERDTSTRFRMTRVEVPLELAFIASDGTVLDVLRTEARSEEIYTIGPPFRYVLEAPAGFFGPRKVSKNGSWLDTSSFDLLLQPRP